MLQAGKDVHASSRKRPHEDAGYGSARSPDRRAEAVRHDGGAVTDDVTGREAPVHPVQLAKTRTSIAGLDAITLGSRPKGRPSLFCGHAGCGKTFFAMTFLVEDATSSTNPASS